MPDPADAREVHPADHSQAPAEAIPDEPAEPAGPAAEAAGAERSAAAQSAPPARWTAAGCSRIARLLATLLVFATFVLMSPPSGQTYPGAKPWSTFSLLKPVTDLMAFNGLLATERGVEIKDFVFHLTAAAALGLLAWGIGSGAVQKPRRLSFRSFATEPWLAAQVLLVGWVAISALSALWSGDPALSRGQAVLYALAVAWAIALAWTLQPPDVPKLLAALAGACTAGAVLCIWYYYERNPYHRPGFPAGNPNTLAIAIVPGILICVSALLAAAEQLFRRQPLTSPRAALAAAAALVPLIWCFLLADSRSATVGLAGGVVAIALLRVGQRLRWAVICVALTGALAGGLWLMQYSRLDAAMGRGATVRFRFYTWRYAAALWDRTWLTAIAGNGAGNYPRLAGQLALRDRRFDPNAFMADHIVEHAHNELFEVLSEIGLVGGVTFVGGFLATLVAGGLLLRRRPRDALSWLYTGVLAALIALVVEACFSPSLRLPVVPALFFTLAGTLWALCRAAAEPAAAAAGALPASVSEPAPASASSSPLLPALGTAVLALVAAWFALHNWMGVLNEERGRQAALLGRHEEAFERRIAAEAAVLDPVRILLNDARAGQALLNSAVALAQESARSEPPMEDVTGAAASAPAAAPTPQEALRQAQAAFEYAVRLGRRAPTLLGAARLEAGAAQLLAELYSGSDATQAAEWNRRAAQGWLAQRSYSPYDFQALLRLTTYRWPPAEDLRLLCDALRAPDAHILAGQALPLDQMRGAWRDALRRLAAREGFDQALELFLAMAGPTNPQTEVDTLIDSRAPETYRVAAYVASRQGDFEAAQQYAERAVALYEPMRTRFPSLPSAAMLEHAEFALLASPGNAPLAAELLQRAISQLPTIQEQKQEALLQPYQRLLTAALLIQGRETEAAGLRASADGELSASLADSYVDLTLLYIHQGRDRRPDVEPWLAAALRHQPAHLYAWSWRAWLAAEGGDRERVDAILEAAGAAGVPPNEAALIRSSLCREFPSFCDG